MYQVNQWHGRRFSGADAYLRPVLKRPNLEVRTGATVLGIDARGRSRGRSPRGRERRGAIEVLRAEREVDARRPARSDRHSCCSCPGIGAPDELRAVGVEVRHALPGVGKNLQDHPFVTVLWEVSDEDTLLVRREAPGRWPSGCCAGAGR